ncbi:MAG: ATP synthase F1 subunit gamma [Candidatus Bipolaricaulota bacterium]|nr:ATP synthase F1 subunit gamma [Candidatus Bipolaricaulota bacterium]
MAENVRVIKDRIGNIENIRQITKAMNAIAMTKVTRMKRRVAAVHPYVEGFDTLVAELLAQPVGAAEPHSLTVDNGSSEVGILVLNSDRGLCGRFKGEINRKGEELLLGHDHAAKILAGGEKAYAYFARRPVEILKTYTHFYENPTPRVAERICSDLISLYLEGSLGRVILVYMRFVSDLKQRLAVEEFLPIKVEAKGSDALIEPEPARMLDVVLPLYLQGKIFSALLHTKTSEDAIRRQAMKSATDNADDLLKVLTRSYNKARQQSITREISDIMGGAEALRDR